MGITVPDSTGKLRPETPIGAVAGGEAKELARLGRIMLQSQDLEIPNGQLALARERFEFNAAKAALAELPNLQQMNQEDAARGKKSESRPSDAGFLGIGYRSCGWQWKKSRTRRKACENALPIEQDGV